MKQIKTKKYIKFAQLGSYPPGVTGNEPYFKDPVEEKNDRETFTILREGKEYNVTVDYSVDMNLGLGEIPSDSNITIGRVVRVTDETNTNIMDFDLSYEEEKEIKDTIIEYGNWNEDMGQDSNEEY